MKYIAIAFLTAVAFVLMRWKREYKGQILTGFVIVMILLSLVHNARVTSLVVPFYRPMNQIFYQTEFLEKGEYPDSFLPLLLKDKKVYTKDDRITLEQAMGEGKNWLYSYYHNENAINILKLSGAEVVPDAALNSSFVEETQMEVFEDLGYANDMFRYSFLLNSFWEELGNYFTYYWYYADLMPELHVYLNGEQDTAGESVFDAKELVVLWDGSPSQEAENLYIMTKNYYESEVAE